MADPDIPVADPDVPMAYANPIPPNAFNPDAPTFSSSATTTTTPQQQAEISERTIDMLLEQGYTRGLAESIRTNRLAFALSIWVVDNSGSMQTQDGHRIVPSTSDRKEVKFVSCTRWAEMQQTVEYHAQLAAVLRSPTIFRLVNDPGRAAGQQQFSIAEKGASHIEEDLTTAQRTMERASPNGVTDLITHLREIRAHIVAMEPQLRAEGTKAVLVLATDGLPSDQRGVTDDSIKRTFVDAMRALEGLPLWVVVRLCTDDQEVVDFWNSLDGKLEYSLEVLDDFKSEAKDIHLVNPWLNYGLPMHRMREMGFQHRLFDILDERRLSKGELRDFFRLLFGDGVMDGVCDPEADWKKFYQRVSEVVHADGSKTWNPATKRIDYWIDLKQLKKCYGGGWFHC